MDIKEILAENQARRHRRLLRPVRFDRFDPDDFQNWAWHCVRIRDKLTGLQVPFSLNRPQRRVLEIMEDQRKRDRPIRLIMLKARQWGGSTLVQMYMAWIQLTQRRNWHSIICAHAQGISSTIRGMLTSMLATYPTELWAEREGPGLRRYEGSATTLEMAGRGCRVTLATAQNPEASRGLDVSMAHLSEVAFYPDTPMRAPGDLVRAVCSGIPQQPMTLIALESTANGQGDYFHREWLRAEQGRSDKAPVFVPWHEIDMYALPVSHAAGLWEELEDHERDMWRRIPDLTLEQLAWYHHTALQYPDRVSMMREYPTTPQEAFQSTDCAVFAAAHVEALRLGCREPRRGDVDCTPVQSLSSPRFTPDPRGRMSVWAMPDPKARAGDYVVGVDVGGRSDRADWSVISVVDTRGPRPEVAAQWRGHIDMDLLGWKAMAVAQFYAQALLVVESNTLESDRAADGEYVLSLLSRSYRNLYRRATPAGTQAVGFHTNRSTKSALVAQMVALAREQGYVERDHGACDEMSQYQRQPNGAYAARSGCHDDIIMSRALALYVASRRRSPQPQADLRPIAARPRW